ncbi:hypothetical protein M422DRAFT_260702 [Sphaerobolus stellatus SS14]|uniref:Uncharacterized protein n=1 Tax=Sphaerobolus stellatus (strain SS14) TaxID=990650 RepID=A0A0C9V5D3_SPHS4|nr:hypothetical protein M422DRAFT_260702 [Sphaerobolus stellatus SS14]
MGASHLEYRGEDASRNVEKADAKQQPRHKRRIAVGCMSELTLLLYCLLVTVTTSLDVAETLPDSKEEEPFLTSMPRSTGPKTAWTWRVALPNAGDACRVIEGRRKASVHSSTPIALSLAAVNANGTVSSSHARITLQLHTISASIIPIIGTSTHLFRSSSSSTLYSMRIQRCARRDEQCR